MTGYTVHTGTSLKFSQGWDLIFKGKKAATPARKAATKKSVAKAATPSVTAVKKSVKKKAAAKTVKRRK